MLATCTGCAEEMYRVCMGLICNVHTSQTPKTCFNWYPQPKHGVQMVHFVACTGCAQDIFLYFMSYLTLVDTILKFKKLIGVYLTYLKFEVWLHRIVCRNRKFNICYSGEDFFSWTYFYSGHGLNYR